MSILSTSTEKLRARVFWRNVFIYFFTLVFFTGLFVAFHYAANQVPQAFIAKKLEREFRNHNLSEHSYPFNVHGAHSILSNIGQNQFTECEILLSTLATPGDKLRDAVLPRILSKEYDKTYCSSLKQFVQELNGPSPGELESRPMRTRYWWGARAVYSYSLRFFNVYQTREMIRNLTSLAYLGLAISLVYLSTSLFWAALPLLIFGTLFSGITYYSEIVLGAPYLWALTAPILLAVLHIKHAPDILKYLSVFAIGMVSSYLWLLEGHILLLLTWIVLIAYFSALKTMKLSAALVSLVKHGFAYAGGFTAAAISGQIIKMWYVGIGPVISSMSKAIAHRSSDVAPGGGDLSWSIVMDKVWGVGYWWTGLFRHELLWDLLISSSIAAAILGMVISLIKGLKGHWQPMVTILVFIAVVAMIFARLFFTQNHVVIHAFFIGRYMFIPLAMGWAMLIVSLYRSKVTNP